jgi:SAM-dependent methyltransferase
VACGSGQASVGLAAAFERVEASDISPAQIALVPAHPRITYRVAAAEASGLKRSSMDAVVVASAIHWLDVPRFNQEVQRVLKPGGLLAWLGYDPLQGAPDTLQQWLDALYHERLQGLWPSERAHVDQRYAGLPFPGISQPIPADWSIPVHWNAAELLGFISTWSALRRSDDQTLIATLQQEVEALWPANQECLPLYLPLMGRWGLLP